MDNRKKSDISNHGNSILLPHKCAEIFKYLRFCCTLVRKYGFGIEDLFTAVYDEAVMKDLRDKLENSFTQTKISDFSEYPTVAAQLILEYIGEIPGTIYSETVLTLLRTMRSPKHEDMLPHMKICFKCMDEETFTLSKYMFGFFYDFVRSTSSAHMNLYRLHHLLAKAIFDETVDDASDIIQKQIIILSIREYDALYRPSVLRRVWKFMSNLILCSKK